MFGITFQDLGVIDKIFRTCCALHNMLIRAHEDDFEYVSVSLNEDSVLGSNHVRQPRVPRQTSRKTAEYTAHRQKFITHFNYLHRMRRVSWVVRQRR